VVHEGALMQHSGFKRETRPKENQAAWLGGTLRNASSQSCTSTSECLGCLRFGALLLPGCFGGEGYAAALLRDECNWAFFFEFEAVMVPFGGAFLPLSQLWFKFFFY
jgi:hypothetical protein